MRSKNSQIKHSLYIRYIPNKIKAMIYDVRLVISTLLIPRSMKLYSYDTKVSQSGILPVYKHLGYNLMSSYRSPN